MGQFVSVILLHMTRTILFFACAAISCAQSAYKKPPEAILKVLNAPATPLANVNPPQTHLLLLEPDRYPPIAELAEPMLRLAGLRINPRNNGQRGGISYGKAQIIDLITLRKTGMGIPAGAKIGTPQWSPDGKTAALLAHYADRIEVMVLETATGLILVDHKCLGGTHEEALATAAGYGGQLAAYAAALEAATGSIVHERWLHLVLQGECVRVG